MVKEVSIDKIVKDAEHIFNNGFACSESIIYSIRKNFNLDLPDDVIAMSSGFPWGLGRAYCICGALAGGTMCLGYFFGRREPGDPKISKCFDLTKELHDDFKLLHSTPCCKVLTANVNRDKGEHKKGCTHIVKCTARKTTQIIIRELNIKNIDK